MTLPSAESDGLTASRRRPQVAVEVRVMPPAAVPALSIQLDDQAVFVFHVPIDDSTQHPVAHLAACPAQSVRALDSGEVGVLQRGAGPLHGVGHDRRDPVSVPQPRPPAGDQQEPVRRRPTRTERLGELGHRLSARTQRTGHVEESVLDSNPRRAEVPQRAVVEICEPPNHNPRGRREASSEVNSYLDRPVCSSARGTLERSQRRGADQDGRLRRQDRRPGTLLPGRRRGVLDVHAGMDGSQLAAADQPLQVVGSTSQASQLSSADDACLRRQRAADGIGNHQPRIHSIRPRRRSRGPVLWTAEALPQDSGGSDAPGASDAPVSTSSAGEPRQATTVR